MTRPSPNFFGQGNGGDVYVLYDNTANRWYVTALDGTDTGLLLAVSKDSNFLDGFLPTYNLAVTGGAGLPDYPKPGFNKDAIFIAFNNFATTGDSEIATINKAAAFAGSLQMYLSVPAPEFRAMTPAQMNGDTTGGVEWFFSTDGNDTGGDTMRVTEMTNYFSDTPTYTYTSIPVAPYQAANVALQPGGTWTTFPNTTTYSVQYLNGMLVTAMASATAADGFTYPKGLYYEVNVSSGTPTLVLQGVIDPGPGVSVQMPSVAIDKNGNLGFTWMEASSTEYVSMWVGSLDTSGHFSSPGRCTQQHVLRRQFPDRRLQHGGARPDQWHDLLGGERICRPRRRQHRYLEYPGHVVLAAAVRGQRLVLDRRRGGQLAEPADRIPRPIREASSRTRPRWRSVSTIPTATWSPSEPSSPMAATSPCSSTPPSPASTTSTSTTIRAGPASTSCRSTPRPTSPAGSRARSTTT